MGITSISETGSVSPASVLAAPAVAAPPAPAPGAAPVTEEARTSAMQPVATPPPPAQPPPPPPPREAYPFEVLAREHAGTGHKIYDIVDEETGQLVGQIPIEAVLDLVADVLRQLEAEGRR